MRDPTVDGRNPLSNMYYTTTMPGVLVCEVMQGFYHQL